MLEQFFAVTINGSIYEISTEISESNWPTVKKISGKPNPNMRTGHCLRNGRLVGLSDIGILLFNPNSKNGKRFEDMSTNQHGGSTSGIVALFTNRTLAEKCVASGEQTSFSEKYIDTTKKTLQDIGNDHPVFIIGESVKTLCNL